MYKVLYVVGCIVYIIFFTIIFGFLVYANATYNDKLFFCAGISILTFILAGILQDYNKNG